MSLIHHPRNREIRIKEKEFTATEITELIDEYNLIRDKQSKLSSMDRRKVDYLVLKLIKEKKLVLSKPNKQ